MSPYALYRLAQWVNAALPHEACLWAAERLADAQWRSSSADRVAVQANLTAVLGHPVVGRSPVVREVFRNFGRYLVEFLNAHQSLRDGMTIEGTEQVAATLKPNQSRIILSAHMGNWELGAFVLARLGFRVSAVVLPHRDPRVNGLFDDQRRRCGVHLIPLGVGVIHHCLKWLREGGLLCIAGDRDFGATGISVSFCGRRTTMPRGPAILSLRTGVPVVPVFLIREGSWRFRFHVEPAIWPPAGLSTPMPATDRLEGPQMDGQVLQLTQRYAQVIQRSVQRFPTQWLMFRPFENRESLFADEARMIHASRLTTHPR